MAVPSAPWQHTKSPRAPCPCQHLAFFSFLTFTNLLSLKQCLVVSLCISLMKSELEDLFLYPIIIIISLCLSFWSPPLGIDYLYPCLIFLLGFPILALLLKPGLRQILPTDCQPWESIQGSEGQYRCTLCSQTALVQIPPALLTAEWPWTSYLPPQCLSFPICNLPHRVTAKMKCVSRQKTFKTEPSMQGAYTNVSYYDQTTVCLLLSHALYLCEKRYLYPSRQQKEAERKELSAQGQRSPRLLTRVTLAKVLGPGEPSVLLPDEAL